MKKNKYYILSIAILIIWFLSSLYVFLNDFNNYKQYLKNSYNECTKENNIECEDIKTELDNYVLPTAPVRLRRLLSFFKYYIIISKYLIPCRFFNKFSV